MGTSWRGGAVLAGLFLTAGSLRGDLLLLQERVDREEVTEVRCSVPFGRVITGLGFRAHYDNMTTMHCRHHRLTAEGQLVDPQEIHAGSEPDHQCEAKVFLPDGWVAVGFGLAGEPEWDVTLLRMWARELNPDGSLGPVKEFSDGFKPNRGPERLVKLEEPDRVLCGAGARFGSNDIRGIYARSRRLVRASGEQLAAAGRFTERVWVLSGMQAFQPEMLRRDVERLRPDRVDLELSGMPEDLMVRGISALTAVCTPQDVKTRMWTSSRGADQMAGLFERCPDLEGLVLSVPPEALSEQDRFRPVYDLCTAAKRSFSLRPEQADAEVVDKLARLPHEIGLVVAAEALESGAGRQLDDRKTLIEIAPGTEVTWRAGLLDLPAHDLAGQITTGVFGGARGLAVRINVGRVYLPRSINGPAFSVLDDLMKDPFQDPEAVRARICREQYGGAGSSAEAAIAQATDANALIFRALNVAFLWESNRLATIDVASSRLQGRLNRFPQGAGGEALRQLLFPTQKSLEELRLEAETARWLLRQSSQNASKAVESNRSVEARLLQLAVARNEAVIAFCNAVKEAFLLGRLYRQDVSPVTRERIASVLAELPELANSATAAIGSTALCEGLEEFTDSIRVFMGRAEREAPLAVAFAAAEKHAAEGRFEEATRSLSEILHDPTFMPHLDKSKKRIAHLASRLATFWTCPENMRVLRGGDGRWTVARQGDRWAWATTGGFPCIYFDVLTGPLTQPADYTLSFEYYDEGDSKIWVNYDSHYEGGLTERQYHSPPPIQLTDSGQWRTAACKLTRCRFGNGQNEDADLRLVGSREKGIYIRNVRLTPDRP